MPEPAGTAPPLTADGAVEAGDGAGASWPPLGRRRFLAGAAGAAGALAAATALGAGTAVAAAGAPSRYVASPTPVRLCDTRPAFGFGFTRSANVTRVRIAGRSVDGVTVPADATAAVFTLVGINRTSERNFLSAFPAGTAWPGTSSLNMDRRDAITPNLVTVRLGAGGAVDVLSNRAADVIVDLAGVYVPSRDGRATQGRFRRVAPARRVVDTRTTPGTPGPGSVVRVDLTALVGARVIDADAQAVSINLTCARPAASGYLTASPFGRPRPTTSSLNVVRGQNRAIGAMVTLGRDADGRIGFEVFLERGGHVLVDVTGFTTGPSAASSTTGLFVPVDPVRLMDTRAGTPAGRKRLWPGWTRAFQLPEAYRSVAGTAVMNLTVARAMGPGFFTVNAAQTRVGTPTTSSLNVAAAGENTANHVVSQVSNAGLECYSQSGGDLIVDLVGYYTGARIQADAPIPPEPPPPAIAPPYTMVIPSLARMAGGRAVLDGAADPIVDSGRVWHWSGTGWVGSGRYNVATFAHRTEAGGPFHSVDRLGEGDRVLMRTSDSRTYVYRYARREITSARDADILAACRRLDGRESLAIIACTVGGDRSKSAYPDPWAPTSLLYRIVVVFVLESWTDDLPLA